MTYSELKAILNRYPDEKLNHNIVILTETEGLTISQFDEAKDDLINPSGDGLEEISSYKLINDQEVIDNEPILIYKGTILLYATDYKGDRI